ncbi:MAG: hypothetical protein M1816_001093 [Peltula sp. TS41687]|nr:MAG: hypothetical protein M1816_001093 [Peltula sp. TS41687]
MEKLHPSSHLELMQQYQTQFDAALKKGDFSLFLYPQGSLGVFILLIYLLLPQHHFPFIRHARIPVFAFIFCFQVYVIRTCRSMRWAIGFGIGILSAWAIVWSAALILFTDPQNNFLRIQCRSKPQEAEENHETDGLSDIPDRAGQYLDAKANGAYQSHNPWMGNQPRIRRTYESKDHDFTEVEKARTQATSLMKLEGYYWEHYPLGNFSERARWIADLVSNFRGIGWNWQIHGLLGPPQEIQDQLHGRKTIRSEHPTYLKGTTGNRTYYTRATLLQRKLLIFLVDYILLDFLKVVMMKDPYFWGLVNSPPPIYLPERLRDSAGLTRAYRLIVTLIAVEVSLQVIFSMAPLLFVGILGPKFIHVRAEPWMYPDFFGGFKMVLEKGLAGWWGGWWHQTFRFAIGAPSRWMIERTGMDGKSQAGRILQLTVAFALSGLLHACGSYTQLPLTHPLRGPFLFFSLQPLGITLQTMVARVLTRSGVSKHCPRALRWSANFLYVHTWFYFTAPLLADDFSRGGIWLFEPVPISPIRGLGWGLKEEGWWCWGGSSPRWHRGDRWWRSGLAL